MLSPYRKKYLISSKIFRVRILDVDAGTLNGKSLVIFTQSHELTHFIKEQAPESFKKFADLLVEKYEGNGVSVDRLVKIKMEQSVLDRGAGNALSYDEAFEEVVCDSCEDFLADTNIQQTITEFAKVDKNLAEKIKEFLKGLVEKLENAIKGLRGQSAEAEFLRDFDIDELEELKALWTSALFDARDNVLQAKSKEAKTEKNTTGEGDAKEQKRSTNNGIAKYTLEQYNAFGWASYNGVIDDYEREALLSNYADYKHNKFKFPKTKTGEVIIHSSKCPGVLLYVKGSIKCPEITKVARINANNDVGVIEKRLIEYEISEPKESRGIIENIFEEGILDIHRQSDFFTFQEYLIVEGKRKNSENFNTDSSKKQNRTRSDNGDRKIYGNLSDEVKFQHRRNVNSFEDLDIDYKKENEILKEDIEKLKEKLALQRTVTHGKVLAKASYEGVAKNLLHEFGMKRVTNKELLDEFIGKLDGFYTNIINEQNLSWDDIYSESLDIAKWIDSKLPEQVVYKNPNAIEILRDIREKGIRLSETEPDLFRIIQRSRTALCSAPLNFYTF